MRALVLSGGGAKGAYEVGVIKALEELKYKPDIVTGTSIGSLNSAFYVQGGYNLLNKLWRKVKIKDMLDITGINELVEEDYNLARVKVAYEAVKNVGIDTNNFYKFLNENINEKKIRKSKINLGIIIFNVNTLKGEEILKSDMEEGLMAKYIQASCSAFPALKGTVIKDNIYIDGGYSDNMPVELACKMGADEVIAVNLKAVGVIKPIKEKYNGKKINVKVISSSEDTGSMLVFTKNEVDKNIILGYIDTMKAFNKCYGNNILISDKTKEKLKRKIDKIKLPKILKNIEDEIKKDKEKFIIESLEMIYKHLDNNDKLKSIEGKILSYTNLMKFIYEKYIMFTKNIVLDINDIIEYNKTNGEKDIVKNMFIKGLKKFKRNYKELITIYLRNLIKENIKLENKCKDNDKDTFDINNKLMIVSNVLKNDLKLAIFTLIFIK